MAAIPNNCSTMSHRTSIYVCLSALESHWGLGEVPVNAGQMLALGWRLSTPPVDSAVPDQIAVMLARALTAVAEVSFLVSNATLSDLDPWGCSVRIVKPASLIERADAVIANEPLNINLAATHQPDTAVRLFEDFGHPWHAQGQVALLSALDCVPQVKRKTLLAALNGAWVTSLAALRLAGVQALVRPGTHGAVAGILSLSEDFTAAFLPALEREVRVCDMEWHLLVERDFAARLRPCGARSNSSKRA